MQISKDIQNLTAAIIALKTNIKKQKIVTSSLKDNNPEETLGVNWELLKPILGKVPDVLIAECYDVSRERVRQIRKKFNIELKSKQEPQLKIPVSELKKFSLVQLAAKYGVRTSYISVQRAIHGISNRDKTITSRLEKMFTKGAHLRMTDREIAHKLGCSISQVQKRRQEMGYYKRKFRTTSSQRSK